MNRGHLIKLINVGRSKLGWDDDMYRGVLMRFGGAPDAKGHVSLKSLTDADMERLVAYLRSMGFRPMQPQRPNNTEVKSRRELTKIEALLTDAGLPWSYAEAIMNRQTNGRKSRLEFCDERELMGILVALEKAACKRLIGELQQIFGQSWVPQAEALASLLFGFDAHHRNIEAYAVVMSKVLRWTRGELQVACDWPVDVEKLNCCTACYQIAMSRTFPQ